MEHIEHIGHIENKSPRPHPPSWLCVIASHELFFSSVSRSPFSFLVHISLLNLSTLVSHWCCKDQFRGGLPFHLHQLLSSSSLYFYKLAHWLFNFIRLLERYISPQFATTMSKPCSLPLQDLLVGLLAIFQASQKHRIEREREKERHSDWTEHSQLQSQAICSFTLFL